MTIVDLTKIIQKYYSQNTDFFDVMGKNWYHF